MLVIGIMPVCLALQPDWCHVLLCSGRCLCCNSVFSNNLLSAGILALSAFSVPFSTRPSAFDAAILALLRNNRLANGVNQAIAAMLACESPIEVFCDSATVIA